jgi:hypothetical protein
MSRGHYNHHHQTSQQLDTNDSGQNGIGRNALASASTISLRQAGEAWFHAIDERYLLPLFSNAVASRKFHARRAHRRAAAPRGNSGTASPNIQYQDSEHGSVPGTPVESSSPGGSIFNDGMGGAVKRKNQEVLRSIESFWRGGPSRPRDREEPREREAGSTTQFQNSGQPSGSGDQGAPSRDVAGRGNVESNV